MLLMLQMFMMIMIMNTLLLMLTTTTMMTMIMMIMNNIILIIILIMMKMIRMIVQDLDLTFGHGRQHVQVDGGAARALPEDGDPVGVAPEAVDVLLHPAEGHDLVLHAEVAGHHLVLRGQESCRENEQLNRKMKIRNIDSGS